MNGLIYKYTYLITGECYIGQTTNFKKRQKEHLLENRTNLRFHNLLRKHYKDFNIEILEDNIPKEKLDEREKYYIQLYDSVNKGFNLTLGGDGGFQACQKYWKNNPEKMKKHIEKIQPLAAKASKEFWKNNPEWKQQHLQNMKKGWKKWKNNNKEQYEKNLKYAQSKAKEWREKNKDIVKINQQKAVNATKKQVKLINTGEIFESASAAGRHFNIAASGISACCRGVRKSCGRDKNNKKMIWRYTNND